MINLLGESGADLNSCNYDQVCKHAALQRLCALYVCVIKLHWLVSQMYSCTYARFLCR